MSGSPDSYWVKPGALVAGEYPGAEHEDEVRPRLATLRAGGIRSLLDLNTTSRDLTWRHIGRHGEAALP